MTQPEGAMQRAGTGRALTPQPGVALDRPAPPTHVAQPAPDAEWLARWAQKRAVMLTALVLVVAQLIWKAGSSMVSTSSGMISSKVTQQLRMAAAGLVGVFVLGSFWSVQQLGSTVSGASTRAYIANATEAVRRATRGTAVYDWPVPENIVPSVFGRYSQASAVIGDLAIGKLRWIRKPRGTIDNLGWFGTDGKLYHAWVSPSSSVVRPRGRACWPERHRQIVVKFAAATSVYTWILRFGYLLGPSNSMVITVSYGNSVKELTVLPGLHAAYLPERGGNVTSVTFGGLGTTSLCVGDVEAGNIVQSPFTKPLP